MNQPLKILCVSILAILAVAVSANAYYNDCSLSNAWNVTGGAIVSNQDLFTPNGDNLYIPASATVSNGVTSAGQKVWTDFLTIPRPFQFSQGTAPAADSNATAQFYVNSTGYWETISQEGTQVCDHVIGVGTYPKVDQYASYYHVSVLNDYSNSTWSLFVNGLPLATNLTSLAKRADGVTGHKWFKVDNLGNQTNDNVCWLDNFEVTNRMPLAGAQSAGGQPLTNNVIPGTDIPQALAFAGFGSFADPRPVNTNATTTSSSATFKFRGVVSGGNYVILRSPSATGGFTPALGLNISGGGDLDAGDLSGASKYFYRVVRVSTDDSSIGVTNSETYAVYKQTRVPGTSYIVGVPVDYVGNDRTLGGPLGTQLATGLSPNDRLTVFPPQATYKLGGGGAWGGASAVILAPGMGVMIEHTGGVASASTVLAGILPTNNVAAVTMAKGYNIVAWPYETPGNGLAAFSGLTSSTGTNGDYIIFQNVTNATTIARWTPTGWMTGTRPGSGSSFNPTLQPGAGIMIYRQSDGGQWAPLP